MATPGDLRAAIARQRIPIYQLAAEVRLHPGRLAQMLNERIPLPNDVATRISKALDRSAGTMEERRR
jgi:plasmid maintenance system antidote protein VapI